MLKTVKNEYQVHETFVTNTTIFLAFLLSLLLHKEYRGVWGRRRQGRYVKTKLQKTASFIAVESLDIPPEHTHPARCLDTSETVPWITFPCLSLTLWRRNYFFNFSTPCI